MVQVTDSNNAAVQPVRELRKDHRVRRIAAVPVAKRVAVSVAVLDRVDRLRIRRVAVADSANYRSAATNPRAPDCGRPIQLHEKSVGSGRIGDSSPLDD